MKEEISQVNLYARIFFTLFKSLNIDTVRERVVKNFEGKLKIVLQVILRRKTTSSVEIFI